MKGKFAVLSIIAAALLCWQLAGVATVNSGIVDPCNSTASSAAGATVVCPQGDGDDLGPAGLTISVTVRDNTNAAVAGIPAADFWLIGCNELLVLCGGSGSINATGATDVNGQTTIDGTIAGSGCDTGVRVVCQGIVLGNGACSPICLPIEVRSFDQAGGGGPGVPDGVVSTADVAYFTSTGYKSPPKPYVSCLDFVGPFGTITPADVAKLASHLGHGC